MSADLEVFEDARIFSKLEPVYIHVMIGFLSKDSTALELVERSPYLLPLYPFRWCILRPILMIVKQKKMDEIHSLAFGGINNSAGKTVTKAIWNRYGKKLPNMFLRNSIVEDMPIGAFRQVKQGRHKLPWYRLFMPSEPIIQKHSCRYRRKDLY